MRETVTPLHLIGRVCRRLLPVGIGQREDGEVVPEEAVVMILATGNLAEDPPGGVVTSMEAVVTNSFESASVT